MAFSLLISGLLILILAAGDFAITTISANRTGPVTRATAAVLWSAFRRLARAAGRDIVQPLAGPVIMCGVAFCWLVLTSLGWLLIFRSVPGSLEMKSSGAPAGWAETFAFVGSSLSTVGAANVRPASALWDNLSMIIAVNGMIVLTLSVTFVLNITQTVASGRGFAALIRVRDPADPRNDDLLLPTLADLCVRLNASPLALYYSSPRSSRGLPESLDWLAQRVSSDPGRYEQYRYVLGELPYLREEPEAGRDRFLRDLRHWATRYSLPG